MQCTINGAHVMIYFYPSNFHFTCYNNQKYKISIGILTFTEVSEIKFCHFPIKLKNKMYRKIANIFNK